MSSRARPSTERWSDHGSDASPALRALMRAASADVPGDHGRLLRVQARMLPLLSGTVSMSPSVAEQAHSTPETTVSSPASTSTLGVGNPLSGGGALLAKLVGVSLLVVGAGSLAVIRAGSAPPARVSQTTSVGPSTGPDHASTSLVLAPAPGASVLEQSQVDWVPRVPAPSTAGARSARSASATGSLTEEVRLLARAHTLLHSAPRDALTLLEQHRARFPQSTLGEERELFAIQALAEVGNRDEATKRAEEFRSKTPESAFLQRAERAVESTRIEKGSFDGSR